MWSISAKPLLRRVIPLLRVSSVPRSRPKDLLNPLHDFGVLNQFTAVRSGDPAVHPCDKIRALLQHANNSFRHHLGGVLPLYGGELLELRFSIGGK